MERMFVTDDTSQFEMSSLKEVIPENNELIFVTNDVHSWFKGISPLSTAA